VAGRPGQKQRHHPPPAALPPGELPVPARWRGRLADAGHPGPAFAAQQTLVPYPQVSSVDTPANGYYPLPPWVGFAVLCGYAVLALGLAVVLLRRRDA